MSLRSLHAGWCRQKGAVMAACQYYKCCLWSAEMVDVNGWWQDNRFNNYLIRSSLDFSHGFELIWNLTDVGTVQTTSSLKWSFCPSWPPGLNCDLVLSTHLSAPLFTQLHPCTTTNLLPCLPLCKDGRRNMLLSFFVMILKFCFQEGKYTSAFLSQTLLAVS